MTTNDAALYDWMADELVAMADEVAGEQPGPYGQLTQHLYGSVAEYVSKTRGSGRIDVVALLENWASRRPPPERS